MVWAFHQTQKKPPRLIGMADQDKQDSPRTLSPTTLAGVRAEHDAVNIESVMLELAMPALRTRLLHDLAKPQREASEQRGEQQPDPNHRNHSSAFFSNHASFHSRPFAVSTNGPPLSRTAKSQSPNRVFALRPAAIAPGSGFDMCLAPRGLRR